MTTKVADAHPVIWYKCPKCNSDNTAGTALILKGFNCVKCKTKWTTPALHGPEGHNTLLDLDKINPLCVEFICDCGKTNLIFMKNPQKCNIEHVVLPEQEEGMELVGLTAEIPTFGVCEDCHEGYRLSYPIPEEVERSLRSKGFPFDGTDEEKSKWMREKGHFPPSDDGGFGFDYRQDSDES